MTDCCWWGCKHGDCHCRLLALEGTRGNCGGKPIMMTEEEERNRTLPGTWPWPRKNNNQSVVRVQVGGNVIIMAWCQISPCRRFQMGEKEWPPLQQQDANNNDSKRCNCDSVALVLLSLLHPCPRQHCAAVFAGVDLVLLPSSRWHLCLPYSGIIALVVLVCLPLLCWCYPLVVLVSLPS
jgi:hypothetical protein